MKQRKRERWKYLRLIQSHETEGGAFRLTDLRIAKIPNDYRRIDAGSPLFMELFTRYVERRKQTIGVKEAERIIKTYEVTEALTRTEPHRRAAWTGSPVDW